VQPIYRVHPAPLDARLSAFAVQTQAIANAHGRDPAVYAWGGPEGPRTLAAFVSGLPRGDDRVTRAIMRQAILVNARSSFSVEPQAHFGVGADIYARFSAPMREIVGVFSHHELVELLCGLGQEKEAIFADEKLRVDVVAAANRSKQTQRKLNDLVSRLVLDAIFAEDAKAPAGSRPVRKGTVMGLTGAKVHVELDDPPVDVKLYLYDLGKALGGAWLAVSPDGATLTRDKGKGEVLRVGDEIAVTLDRHDPKTDRWVLAPVGLR
jgi:ribonuclease R